MTIGKNNIEAHLLDYLEGNLDPLLIAELMAFLAENPEYEKWLPEYDGYLCLTGNPAYGDKSSLKKDYSHVPAISEENFDEFCIALSEDLLKESDIKRLNDFLSTHPGKRADFNLFRQLKLKPDPALVYPHKTGLKKRTAGAIRMRYIYYAVAVAASVSLFIMLNYREPPSDIYSEAGPSALIEEKIGSSPLAVPEITAGIQPGQANKSHRTVKPGIQPGADPQILPVESGRAVQLAAIEPIRPVKLQQGHPMPAMHKNTLPVQNVMRESPVSETLPDEDMTALKSLGHAVKKLNFWKVTESALTGFNYLTESQLMISKTTDQNGRITGLALDTEQYTITGNKLK